MSAHVARYAGQVVKVPKGFYRRSKHTASGVMLACPGCGVLVPLLNPDAGTTPSLVDCSSCDWHGTVRLDGWRS